MGEDTHAIKVTCPQCKSERTVLRYGRMDKTYRVDLYGITRELSIRQCRDCGQAFTWPQLLFEDLKHYFSEDYRAYHASVRRKGLLARFAHSLKAQTLAYFFGYGKAAWWGFLFYPLAVALGHYPRFVQGGRLLDIGCGSGNFIVEMKERGWSVAGTDPSPIAIATAGQRGIAELYQGLVEEIAIPEHSFDVITMFHVFEHVPNGDAVLQKVKKLLKPGGQLIIAVPNMGSIGSRLYRRFWGGLSFPLHCYHYDKHTLRAALVRNGFAPRKTVYTNFLSDLLVTSPQSMFNPKMRYRYSNWFNKLMGIINRVVAPFDYLLFNMIGNWTSLGAQITIVSTVKE